MEARGDTAGRLVLAGRRIGASGPVRFGIRLALGSLLAGLTTFGCAFALLLGGL